MFGYHCPDCVALFAEMRSAVNEAEATAKIASDLIHASKPSEHVDELRQIRERWENASRRWVEASTDLKNHFATHHGTPISVANVRADKNKSQKPR